MFDELIMKIIALSTHLWVLHSFPPKPDILIYYIRYSLYNKTWTLIMKETFAVGKEKESRNIRWKKCQRGSRRGKRIQRGSRESRRHLCKDISDSQLCAESPLPFLSSLYPSLPLLRVKIKASGIKGSAVYL